MNTWKDTILYCQECFKELKEIYKKREAGILTEEEFVKEKEKIFEVMEKRYPTDDEAKK